MALSCYSKSNWNDEIEANYDSELMSNIMFAQPQLMNTPPHDQLLEYDSNSAFSDSSYYVNPFLGSSQDLLFCSNNNYSSLLDPFVSSPPENLNYTLFPEIFPMQQEPYPYLNSGGYVIENNTSWFPEHIGPEIHGPIFSDFGCSNNSYLVCGGTSYGGEVGAKNRGNNGGGSLSAQSIAARERRRKISDKTQELGKLIPGGHKMNTAQMFQAAFKYIKFLQAQLAILQTMASFHQKSGESLESQEMEALLGSSLIQEKLYAADKCLVPKKLLEYVANNHNLQANIDDHHSSLDIKNLI